MAGEPKKKSKKRKSAQAGLESPVFKDSSTDKPAAETSLPDTPLPGAAAEQDGPATALQPANAGVAGHVIPLSPAWFAAVTAECDEVSSTSVNDGVVDEDVDVILVRVPPGLDVQAMNGVEMPLPAEEHTSEAVADLDTLRVTHESDACAQGLHVLGVHGGKASFVPVAGVYRLHHSLAAAEPEEEPVDELLLKGKNAEPTDGNEQPVSVDMGKSVGVSRSQSKKRKSKGQGVKDGSEPSVKRKKRPKSKAADA